MDERVDVAVIGAGLSGLAVAIRLKQYWPNKTITILEKNSRPGGRCHETTIADFATIPLTVGCNGLGSDVTEHMQEFDITKQKFIITKHQFIYKGETLTLPPEPADDLTGPSTQAMLNFIPLYFFAKSSDAVKPSLAQNSPTYNYGYDKPTIPVGGTSSIIANMVERFESLGGKIQYNATHVTTTLEGPAKKITYENTHSETPVARQLSCGTVISSVSGWQQYPANAQESLAISAFVFVVDGTKFQYPEGIHTTVFFPDDYDAWMKSLNAGHLPPDFGFHCFKTPQKEPQDCYGMSIYFFSPRNKIAYSSEEQHLLEKHLMHTMNKTFPGFSQSIQAQAFYPAHAYEENFGFSSTLVSRFAPTNFHATSYNAQTGEYYVGNAVNVDDEQHVGGALRSAKIIEQKISQQMLSQQSLVPKTTTQSNTETASTSFWSKSPQQPPPVLTTPPQDNPQYTPRSRL